MPLAITTLQGNRVSTTSAYPLNSEKLSPLSTHSVRNNRADFPDSPLISTRPLRYNVQLNQQLTAVQQADDYLLEVEHQISQLHRTIIQKKPGVEVQQCVDNTGHWLQHRAEISAGTIDRQLNATPERAPMVNFTLDNASAMLHSSQAETVLFSLADSANEIVAVRFKQAESAEQNLLRLNKGLGRLGIHGKLSHNGDIHFSVDETRWARINQYLTVKGEGERFSAGRFQPLAVQAEAATADQMIALTKQPYTVENSAIFGRILGHLTRQLQQLNEHKSQVRSQISHLSCFEQPGSARAAALALAQKLQANQQKYGTQVAIAQVMSNLNVAIVKNVIR
jgi:hypothetical protein